VFPIGKTLGASLVTDFTPQLSAVVGDPSVTLALAVVQEAASTFTVTGAAQIIVGLIVSTTVTICVQVAVFPALSVTVQVTVVFPIGKTLGASLVTDFTPQLSAVVGDIRVTLALAVVQEAASTFTVTGAAQVMVGLILSTTVTI
jgi:hypothetical protein